MNLAADNFLIPNGTFFVVLLIFVIVLVVIWTMVVPPILKVLQEREAMINKTANDEKSASAQFDDAESRFRQLLKKARGNATAARDDARTRAREELESRRKKATAEAEAEFAAANDVLSAQGAQAAAVAGGDVDTLARELAAKVLGIDAANLGQSTKSGSVS